MTTMKLIIAVILVILSVLGFLFGGLCLSSIPSSSDNAIFDTLSSSNHTLTDPNWGCMLSTSYGIAAGAGVILLSLLYWLAVVVQSYRRNCQKSQEYVGDEVFLNRSLPEDTLTLRLWQRTNIPTTQKIMVMASVLLSYAARLYYFLRFVLGYVVLILIILDN